MSKTGANISFQTSPIDDEKPATHEVLLGPACRLCGNVSRLTGIEPHPQQDHIDLRSYECTVCGHPFTIDVLIDSKNNGNAKPAGS